MKNVLLIGNGFDLHHKLPTKYADFMCIAEYLTYKGFLMQPKTIGDIFSKCKDNENINDCYSAHKAVFDVVEFNSEDITRIANLLRDNIWFNYFLDTFNKDLGWIDFEKEISNVISVLDRIIIPNDKVALLPQNELLPPFILKNFDFFVNVYNTATIMAGEKVNISNKYLWEYPYNSGIYISDKKKIFDELYVRLQEFTCALKLYFRNFIETPLDLLKKDNCVNEILTELTGFVEDVISFNYTSTLEKMYSCKNVCHIHGNIADDKIVLGVNPNKSDDVDTSNTSLIKFKNYYQRDVLSTDPEYLNWYRQTIITGVEYRIIVFGHSLDVTDKDILSDMFRHANEIYIIYHDKKRRDDYFNNLVRLFGYDEFNEFKTEKHLAFISLLNIEVLLDKMKPQQIEWQFYGDSKEQIVVI